MTVKVPLPHRVGPTVPIPEVPVHMLLLNLIKETIREDPARIAFIHHDNPSLPSVTYRQLVDASTRFASFLQKNSIAKKGEIVAACIPSSWYYGAVTLSLPANGFVLSGFSHRSSLEEALYQLNDTEAVSLITTADKLRQLIPILSKTPRLHSIILIDKPTEEIKTKLKHRLFVWDEIMERTEPEFDFGSVDINVHEDLYVLPYSSGTTGRRRIRTIMFVFMAAKGRDDQSLQLRHTENNVAIAIQKYVDNSANDHPLILTPLYHAMGFFLMSANLARGNTNVLIQRYTEEAVFDAIQKYKTRAFSVPPSVCQRFIQSPLASKYDLSSLVNIGSGGSTQSAELARKFQSRFPDTKLMTQGYGMTELTTVCHSSSAKAVPGSIGIILPNNEYRIVDPSTGRECGTNEPGELWVRGPTVMKGYWKNPKATAEMITRDGWLKTGDLVTENPDREFFVVGRLKELIKVNAFQVPPTELEELISKLDGVADCAVIGIPDQTSGELPRAFVVRVKGIEISAEKIIEHVKKKASHYKWLKGGVEFVDSIPRSEPGKILRRDILRDHLRKKKARL